MRGFGGVLAFSLRGGFEAVRRMVGGLRLAHRAASLGSVGTLVGPPSTTSHVELSEAERAAAGIPEALVRYSVGSRTPRPDRRPRAGTGARRRRGRRGARLSRDGLERRVLDAVDVDGLVDTCAT
jgi:hypothetical protein